VQLGRKPKLKLHQQREAIKRRESGEPIREIARNYDIHNSTISRLTASRGRQIASQRQCDCIIDLPGMNSADTSSSVCFCASFSAVVRLDSAARTDCTASKRALSMAS
jgi:helix-turn-helix resolvase-like protein